MRACSSGGSLVDVGGEAGAAPLPLLHRWPLGDVLGPALDVFGFLEVLALHLVVHRPRVADHVGDRNSVAGEPGAVSQAVVQHAVEAVGLVGEAVDRVFWSPSRSPRRRK